MFWSNSYKRQFDNEIRTLNYKYEFEIILSYSWLLAMHTGSFQVGDFIEDIEEIIFYLKIVHDLYQFIWLGLPY